MRLLSYVKTLRVCHNLHASLNCRCSTRTVAKRNTVSSGSCGHTSVTVSLLQSRLVLILIHGMQVANNERGMSACSIQVYPCPQAPSHVRDVSVQNKMRTVFWQNRWSPETRFVSYWISGCHFNWSTTGIRRDSSRKWSLPDSQNNYEWLIDGVCAWTVSQYTTTPIIWSLPGIQCIVGGPNTVISAPQASPWVHESGLHSTLGLKKHGTYLFSIFHHFKPIIGTLN